MVDCTYEVCGPSVVGEVIDGEAIIMDLRSGAYYSTDGVGGAIWKAIEDGASHSQLMAFAGAGSAAEVAGFIEELLFRELIRKAPPAQVEPAIEAFAGPYARPVLAVHADMKDLIMLDPIHDVNEMGWPTRKVEA
ncbi:MAG: PqqD family protein [Caulobacteraceae bacterium]